MLLLFLLAFHVTASSAHAQTVWALNQRYIDQEHSITTASSFTANNIAVSSDPVLPGSKLQQRKIAEVDRVVNENDGGITVDRFRNRVWSTNGDRHNLQFTSFAIDPDADPSGTTVISNIAGNYPFGSNITGITIMYGFNGRPKRMYCVSFNQYSYINMRGGQWTWAPASELKTAPNGNYPIRDIAFGIVQMREGTQWTRHPALFGVEYSGILYAWDVKEPENGLLFTAGCALFDVRGIAVDTSQPISVIWDGQGDRRYSGRLLCLGKKADGRLVVRDSEAHIDWGISVDGDVPLGLAGSSELVDLTSFVGAESTGIGVRAVQTGSSAAQPMMPLRDGEQADIRIAATNAGAYQGYRAYFVAQVNRLNLVQSNSAERSEVLDVTEAVFKIRGTYDPATESFVAKFQPQSLVAAQIESDEQYYYYGQWVFVPPHLDEGLGTLPKVVHFSDMCRIAVSNAQ